MPTRNYKPEQIVTIQRQIEVQMANGKTVPQACKEAGIHTQTFYRWRKEYGGLKLEQAKRLKELEKENARLKRVVAELSLEKQATGRVETAGSPFNLFVFSTFLPFLSLRKTVSSRNRQKTGPSWPAP